MSTRCRACDRESIESRRAGSKLSRGRRKVNGWCERVLGRVWINSRAQIAGELRCGVKIRKVCLSWVKSFDLVSRNPEARRLREEVIEAGEV